MNFTVADFDFSLPPELIAQHPAPERSASRLLDGRAPQPVDRIFRELPGLLQPGDLLVFNDTRVIKARLHGVKASGGKIEVLVERILDEREVWAQVSGGPARPRRSGKLPRCPATRSPASSPPRRRRTAPRSWWRPATR